MKKKPPAGATLIARLREARIKRDEQVAERTKGKPSATKASKVGKPARAASSAKVTVSEDATSDTLLTVAESTPPKSTSLTISSQVGKNVDLFHREISIEDLRPATDDYELLTEEIRLAGRFAAVGLIAQGLRLSRLKDDEIYVAHYQTFEEYCRSEHTMSATYAYRLIRIAEMAERLAEEGTKITTGRMHDAMPDPFEVMLGLGHRHLLTLLPLEFDTAEDLLVHGIPMIDETGKAHGRIPIEKATEQQIRKALKYIAPKQPAIKRTDQKKKSGPASVAVRNLSDLIDLINEWSAWIKSSPPEEAIADKVGTGREVSRLVQKLHTACERLSKALEEPS
ncbi:MAG: hypothetical protein K2X29_13935 [Candidatus Obscuribacterales bacterium]|nr:hypothetical protein [Candidatus Obscuribacterales bacterium]